MNRYLGVVFAAIVFLVSSQAFAENYPQIKVFVKTECVFTGSASPPFRVTDEPESKPCDKDISSHQQANKWLKEKGGEVQILHFLYDFKTMKVIIVWRD